MAISKKAPPAAETQSDRQGATAQINVIRDRAPSAGDSATASTRPPRPQPWTQPLPAPPAAG